jgi:hypothetical protein
VSQPFALGHFSNRNVLGLTRKSFVIDPMEVVDRQISLEVGDASFAYSMVDYVYIISHF